jgi:mycothiol synthase
MTSIGRRRYAGESDRQAMMAVAAASATENLHVLDLPYRLSSWALDDPANVGLWAAADGQLVAWAVLQTPFWAIDYAYRLELAEALHGEILTWADGRARAVLPTSYGRPRWYVNVFSTQAERTRDLERAGFANQEQSGAEPWSKVLLARAAALPCDPVVLPTGFSIRPLLGELEVEAYVELHRAAFASRNMTRVWRRRTLQRPEYVPELDLVAEAPDGRLAGFCICWLSPTGPEGRPGGQIEPLGVHAEFRSLGLSRALLAEGLGRLQRLGAEQVYVETDSCRSPALSLYLSAGFSPLRQILVYRKDYGKA